MTPSKVFVIDGLGAVLSALFLGIALPAFDVGVPREQLYLLAGVALLLALNGGLAWRFAGERGPGWLRLTACLNLGYTLLTGGLLSLHASAMTGLGLLYFGGEIVIILCLAAWELRVASAASEAPEAD